MILFEVVREFLDEEKNVKDFVVIEGFLTRDIALMFAKQQVVNDTFEQISIYESDDNGQVLKFEIVKTY